MHNNQASFFYQLRSTTIKVTKLMCDICECYRNMYILITSIVQSTSILYLLLSCLVLSVWQIFCSSSFRRQNEAISVRIADGSQFAHRGYPRFLSIQKKTIKLVSYGFIELEFRTNFMCQTCVRIWTQSKAKRFAWRCRLVFFFGFGLNTGKWQVHWAIYIHKTRSGKAIHFGMAICVTRCCEIVKIVSLYYRRKERYYFHHGKNNVSSKKVTIVFGQYLIGY